MPKDPGATYDRNRFTRALRVLRWTAAGAVLLCVLACGACQPQSRPTRFLSGSGWEVHNLPWKVEGAFNLSFIVDASAGSSLRIEFGPDEGEALFVLELGPDGISCLDQRDGAASAPSILNRVTLAELSGHTLIFQQRPHRWALVADGEIMAAGNGPLEAGWAIRMAALRGAGDVAVRESRFQRLPGIRFADGFMRTAADPTSWEEAAGEWMVNVATNPLLSANAFWYSGTGEPKAVAVAGEPFWSDIHFEVACRPAAEGAMGIYLCYRAADDCYLFRWTSDDSERPCKQFIRIRGEEETVLAESPGGYAPGQWYTLRALVGAGWARVAVDDKPVFLVRDSGLTYGRIGLHVEGKRIASFDDVVVESRPAFLAVSEGRRVASVLTRGGEWMAMAPAPWEGAEDAGRIAVSAKEPARLVWAGCAWGACMLSARIAPWERGTMGLVFAYVDDMDFYSIRWEKSGSCRLRLCRTVNGRTTTLAERAMGDDERAHDLAVLARDGFVRVLVDGRPVLSRADCFELNGRVGLLAEQIPMGVFSRVMCEALPPPAPMPRAARDAFAAEPAQMQTWAGSVSDWVLTAYSETVPRPVHVWWHRLDFFGDVRVEMRLKEPVREGEEVGILLNGDGHDLASAYRACLTASGKPDRVRAEVVHGGQVLAAAEASWPAGPMTFGFRRGGETLSVLLGGRTILHVSEARPGDGRRIGWYALPGGEAARARVTPADLDIYAPGTINETFDLAPTDWRVGGGLWNMSNKWQCDPRWSFFSGQSDRLAAIWFKRPLHGDFSIEYFVGNKMQRERGQKYEYAQDMNLSFCADGEDLGSGYTLLFGGYDDTVTAFFRKGKKWALPLGGKPVLINRSGALHRHWYHVRVRRTGKLLQAWIDGALVLSKEDPDPLPDGHFAIWTYNNGIMIARVRISAEAIGPREDPDVARGPTTQPFYTLYDEIAKGADRGD